MDILIICLLLINAVGFLLMRADKNRAVNKRWRIRENTFMCIALIGGCVGILLGMHIFRHKTKHIRFCIGIPLILSLQIVMFVFCAIHFL